MKESNVPKLNGMYLRYYVARSLLSKYIFCAFYLTLGNGKVPTLSNFDFDCKIVTE